MVSRASSTAPVAADVCACCGTAAPVLYVVVITQPLACCAQCRESLDGLVSAFALGRRTLHQSTPSDRMPPSGPHTHAHAHSSPARLLTTREAADRCSYHSTSAIRK